MEILDKLDSSIGDLLNQLDSLREENERLKGSGMQELEGLRAENAALKNELDQEKLRTKTALDRVETIIQRLRERTFSE